MNDTSRHALSVLSDFKNWSESDKDKFVHYIMGELDGEEKARKEIMSKLKELGISVPDNLFSKNASAVT